MSKPLRPEHLLLCRLYARAYWHVYLLSATWVLLVCVIAPLTV